MVRHALTLLALFLLISLPAAPGALAREELPAETRLFGYSADLDRCQSDRVLGQIQSRFNGTESRYWGGTVEITGFEAVREAAFRPHGLDLIPRRYCSAVARLSNHRKAKVRFAVIEDSGFAGLWDSVQFCVAGYDRNHTAMPGCARLDR